MRILILAYEYPPLGGGVGNALSNILPYFAQRQDLEIDFVTTSVDGVYKVEQKFENIQFHFLGLGDRRHKLHRQKPIDLIQFAWKSYWYTWKLVFKHKYDLSVAFGFPGGLVPMLFRWRMRYIVALRGVDVPGYNPRFRKWYFIYKPLSYIVWQFATAVTANSSGLRDLARETHPKKDIEIIPNGVDTERFKPATKKFAKFTVTAGGTLLGKLKGIDHLIKGFAMFARDKQDVQLLLIGSGDEEASLKQLSRDLGVSDKVNFVGRQNQVWIAENLPKCHVYCLPSQNEGMSNSALEGLASGLPLLLTDTGGSKELLVEGENGFGLTKADDKAISTRLELLYVDRALLERLSSHSRSRAEAMRWELTAERLIELFLRSSIG